MSLIPSAELFRIARLTLGLGYDDLARGLLDHLLQQLPSHVAAHCLLGERYVAQERWAEAQEHFDYPLSVDPVNLLALRGAARVALERGLTDEANECLRRAWELYPYDPETRGMLGQPVDDGSPLVLARVLTALTLHEEALPYYEAAFEEASAQVSEHPVEALALCEALWRAGRSERARPFVETVVGQQSSWVRAKLILADLVLGARQDARAVALLHDATALDASCVVARELFAEDERYDWLTSRSLAVPAPPSELLDDAPAVVRHALEAIAVQQTFSASARMDRSSALTAGAGEVRLKGEPETGAVEKLRVATPMMELSEQQPEDVLPISKSEEEVLVRLVLSSRERLIARYGDEGFCELDARLLDLCDAASASTGHEVVKIYVDDEQCLGPYGLSRVDRCDAEQVADLIERLNASLTGQHKRLISVLIIGGDSVVPFHRVANPADDDDVEVLSDWPYAAPEDSPLLAQFSVGRLPDGDGADPQVLLDLIGNATRQHMGSCMVDERATSRTWLNPIRRLLGSARRGLTSVGYSAEVWAEAARAVFELIGDGESLYMSPPLTDYDFLTAHETMPALGYFNLHGFQGSPYWYGHGESEQGTPLLPVALTPLSVSWSSAQGAVVYSEACYGAGLGNDSGAGCIALNFLARGAVGFVGSTAMSYGSLAPPLSGADLLGRYFWEGILDGLTVGHALLRARSSFVRAAATDQGYLDGEDQKALLSFVLYGDPSVALVASTPASLVEAEVEVTCPPLAYCAKIADSESIPLPQELKQKVQRSVPFLSVNGLEAHPLILCRVACSGEECASDTCHSMGGRSDALPDLMVASQRKVVSKGADQLGHVVKVTVNAEGDVLKVLMSRGGIRVDGGTKRR